MDILKSVFLYRCQNADKCFQIFFKIGLFFRKSKSSRFLSNTRWKNHLKFTTVEGSGKILYVSDYGHFVFCMNRDIFVDEEVIL